VSAKIEARTREFYEEVVNAGAIDRMDEFLTEDFVDHEDFPGISPDREGAKQFFSMMRSAFPDFRMEIDDLLAQGDKVAVRFRMTGTHEGEFMGIAPTHKRIDVNGVDFLRIVDEERAAEHWGVLDAMALMQQLGAIPAQAPA
jgi:steroid delta-isomerase-like uncharacterized protein